MATPSASSDVSSASSQPRKYNLRNPLPLSATQEQEVKKLYYKRVRGHCAPEIKGVYCSLCILSPRFPGITLDVEARRAQPGDSQRAISVSYLPPRHTTFRLT